MRGTRRIRLFESFMKKIGQKSFGYRLDKIAMVGQTLKLSGIRIFLKSTFLKAVCDNVLVIFFITKEIVVAKKCTCDCKKPVRNCKSPP